MKSKGYLCIFQTVFEAVESEQSLRCPFLRDQDTGHHQKFSSLLLPSLSFLNNKNNTKRNKTAAKHFKSFQFTLAGKQVLFLANIVLLFRTNQRVSDAEFFNRQLPFGVHTIGTERNEGMKLFNRGIQNQTSSGVRMNVYTDEN